MNTKDTNDDTKVREEINALKADLVDIKNDVKGVAAALAEAGKSKAQALAQGTAATAQDLQHTLGQEVQRHPTTYLLGAVGVGVLAGLLLRGSK
jgi:hypothetical protein